MLGSTWSWLVPLVGAALAFVGVLSTTPPGLHAIGDVLTGPPRGAFADADAYALGSAASLALVALLLLAAACALVERAVRHWRRIIWWRTKDC